MKADLLGVRREGRSGLGLEDEPAGALGLDGDAHPDAAMALLEDESALLERASGPVSGEEPGEEGLDDGRGKRSCRKREPPGIGPQERAPGPSPDLDRRGPFVERVGEEGAREPGEAVGAFGGLDRPCATTG